MPIVSQPPDSVSADLLVKTKLASSVTRKQYRLGFDIGGTFTDLVMIDDSSGQITSYKLLTTPHEPAAAVMDGVRHLLEHARVSGHAIDTAIHGTTLITNAIVERKGARTSLITTKGFRDILEIGKEMRYDIYDLRLVLPAPLVARPLRLEVTERLNARGEVVTPIVKAELEALKSLLVHERVEAIAVCLLHSYRNPAHEQIIRAWLQENFPLISVSLSCEVAPEIREFERMSTTVANAYVQPLTERYLTQLEDKLHAIGFERRLYLMLSSGGIGTVDTARRFPVRMLESGPAAGVLAAAFYGELVCEPSLVSFDMGGTTAKMCLIKDGHPSMTSTFEVARENRFKRGSGLPVRIPAIELIEIGAGGGSLARINELGLLKVGPDSAGADPGPACYGFGGVHPTVTDANLLLGYLNPAYFLGGRMQLDKSASEKAVATDIAGPLRIDPIVAAHAIHQVVNEGMIAATRIHVAEQNQDPRRLKLIAFGGAGPVHAHQIALALKMRGYVIPASAGVTSALGFLTAPTSFDFARSIVARLTSVFLPTLDVVYKDLESQGRAMLSEAGVADTEMRFLRKIDLRHVGQGHEISLPLPFPMLADIDLDTTLRPYFYDFYAGIYGHAHHHLALEVVTCRLTATGPRQTVSLPVAPTVALSITDALVGERPAYFPELGGFVQVPIYNREKLAAGIKFQGPAILEEKNSTAVIGPGAEVLVDRFANLLATFI